jgi:hypothetical protein
MASARAVALAPASSANPAAVPNKGCVKDTLTRTSLTRPRDALAKHAHRNSVVQKPDQIIDASEINYLAKMPIFRPEKV